MSKSETKKKPKFDLSDGIGREDFLAIIHGIWYLFILILKIILWPWIWALRELGRTMRFLRHSHDEALNNSERRYLESLPLFFTVIGLLGGFAVAIIVVIGVTDFLGTLLDAEEISDAAETVWDGIVAVAGAIWGAIAFVIGVGVGTFEFTADAFEEDPVVALVGFSFIGLILVVGIFIISETRVVQRLYARIGASWGYITTAPTRAWNRVNEIYFAFNKKFAGIVVGKKRFDNYSQKFFHKVLIGTIGLGVWTFFVGMALMVNTEFDTTNERLIFLSIVLFMLGVVAGVIELAFLTRVLALISRDRYLVSKPVASSSPD